MPRLFWRLFFALWLSIMAFAVITAWVSFVVSRQEIPDPPDVAYARNIDKAERMLDLALRRGGPERAGEIIEQLPWPVRNQVLLFNAQGEEILGRQRSRQLLDSDNAQSRRRTLMDRNGQSWSLVVLRRGPPSQLLQPGGRGAAWRLLIAALISALVSWWLARSLTRPLEALGRTSRQLSTGDLDVRVAEKVTARRDEFGALGRDLNAMAQHLGEAQQSSRRLLRDVSHELRSPLARQRVALELARGRAGSVIPAELDRIELESERLESLVGEVLGLLRETSRASPFEPVDFDLAELLSDLADVIDYELPEEAPRVTRGFTGPIIVHADRELLWRALENLLRNAVLHSDPGASIALEARRLAGSNEVEMLVRDRGPGVPESQLEAIFDPFSRVEEARDRSTGGHGLGLAIAAAAVKRHQGSISARNRARGGLEMRLLLPIGV